MSLEDNIRALERTPVLADIGHEALRLLAFSIEQKRLGPREALFALGDEADCAYVLVSGRIGLADPSGEVRMVGPGTLIGEMALISGAPRNATVTTSEDSSLLVVTDRQFWDLLERAPDMQTSVIKAMGARLQTLDV